MRARVSVLVLPLLLMGCTLGPNYKRPAVPAPPQFRGAAPNGAAASLADSKWFDLFQDETLKQLVNTAIEKNFDLGIASERVLEARARYRIAGAELYPLLGAQGQFTASRQSSVGSNTRVTPGTSSDVSYTQAGAALSWELDFWGRVRRLKESARASYLATEEGRRGVVVSLIGDVMAGYFTLRELDLELDIASRTRDIAGRNLKLVQLRHDRGAATGLDVHQAEQLLYTATAQIASTQRDIEQTENSLSLLLGGMPGDIARGRPLDQFTLPAEVPPGLPSSLLERRPDIRQAEQNLVAANAEIGAAKALYFPQISLTGFLGGQSRALSDLLTGPARYWVGGPSAVLPLPIFNASQIRAGVRLSEAQKREMVLTYQKAIYNALREVSDALVGYDRTRQQRAQQELLVSALSETTRLSTLRYQGGLDSYLQVLDADRNLFQGQLALAKLRLQAMLSFVELYRALGGGWQ
jgi:NodT family efflux transporter outer membrane factor (OMF) lipoprotein